MSQPPDVLGFADLKITKARLNIPDTTTASDEKIQVFMQEADTYINTQIRLHDITDLTTPDLELISLASGLAASTYNYWQTPAKDRTLDGIKEWKKHIQEYVLATYGKKNPTSLTGGNTFGRTGAITGFSS